MSTRRERPLAATRLVSAFSATVLITGLGAVAAASGVSAAAERCHPEVIDMGTLGGSSSGIIESNNRGLWVGTSLNADEVDTAVIWEDGQIRDLGAEGWSEGFDVNNRGTVGGNHKLSETTGAAFIWRDGVVRELASPFETGLTWIRRMNDRDDVAGAALDTDWIEHPVVWPRGGDPVVLPIPEGYIGAFLMAINDRGDAVGATYKDDPWQLVAWGWDKDGTNHHLADVDLNGLSQANVLDNQGRVGGISDFGTEPDGQAALWRDGAVRSLGTFGDSEFSWVLGTNWKGDYVGVGNYYVGEDAAHVFLTSEGDSGPLRTLMPLSGDPADESGAHAITGGNVMVGGDSVTGSGDIHATVWTCAYQQAFVPDLDTVQSAQTGDPAVNRRLTVRGSLLGPAWPARIG